MVEGEELIGPSDSLCCLPEEIILNILSSLNRIQLIAIGFVNRKIRRLSADDSVWNVRKCFPFQYVFDEVFWATHVDLSALGLDVKDAPPFNKDLLNQKLRKVRAPSIKGNKQISYLTIPKGLSIKNILSSTPSLSQLSIISHFLESLVEIPVDKTYNILITNDIFEGSESLSLIEQLELLKEKECELPKLVEVLALIILFYLHSGTYLYRSRNHSLHFTRCADPTGRPETDVTWRVGGVTPGIYGGIRVGYTFIQQENGVAGVFRLQGNSELRT
jgi:hypothetical protein